LAKWILADYATLIRPRSTSRRRAPPCTSRPQFRIEEQRAPAFAAARGFGVIVAADERGPRASHVPFVVDQRDGRVVVQLHLTARNPLVELADAPGVFS